MRRTREGSNAAGLRLRMPARPWALAPMRQALRTWLARCRLDDDRTCDAVLAVTEACSNSVEHGYAGDSGTVDVRGDVFADHLCLEILDSGGWKPTQRDEGSCRGRGLEIIRTLFPDMTVAATATSTLVRFSVPLAPA
ncbi:ATP-binding protein [Nocardia yunnanensis]|nr:ATP-binding protein [Nocardia yunnanensis]